MRLLDLFRGAGGAGFDVPDYADFDVPDYADPICQECLEAIAKRYRR